MGFVVVSPHPRIFFYWFLEGVEGKGRDRETSIWERDFGCLLYTPWPGPEIKPVPEIHALDGNRTQDPSVSRLTLSTDPNQLGLCFYHLTTTSISKSTMISSELLPQLSFGFSPVLSSWHLTHSPLSSQSVISFKTFRGSSYPWVKSQHLTMALQASCPLSPSPCPTSTPDTRFHLSHSGLSVPQVGHVPLLPSGIFGVSLTPVFASQMQFECLAQNFMYDVPVQDSNFSTN